MPGPMQGIRIVDCSIALAGPLATVMLADQGADVIKVERPGIGDIGRWIGVAVGGMSALFQMGNRGKRSIAVDVAQEEGREIVRRLARDADVFVQNFRPGVVERLGLGYDDLRRERDDLVYLSISGFGPEGPYAQKGAYDNVVQAYSGLAASQADGPDGEPRFLQQTAADKITALTAAQAVTAALFARQRGGSGQHVQLAMLEAAVSFLWADAAGNEVLLDSDGRLPSNFMSGARALRYRDGWGTAAPVSDADFAGMCRAFGVPVDPRIARVADRWQRPDLVHETHERIRAVAATLDTAEATRRLEAENVPCGVVLAPRGLADDPHVRETGMLVDSLHPVAGRMRQPRPPARFAATPAALGAPAPTLGQHTDEILREAGLGERIAALRQRGVVA